LVSKALRDAVEDALKRVRDPETGEDVVMAGLVRGLEVREGRVSFALEVSPERGAQAEPLRAACEAATRAVAGVTAVTAVLTAHTPSQQPGAPKSRASAQAVASRATAGMRAPSLPGVGAVIAVASGKGGVGKSTIAVNLPASGP
jgi:ATP-binding protein involved in chromosome partitioning